MPCPSLGSLVSELLIAGLENIPRDGRFASVPREKDRPSLMHSVAYLDNVNQPVFLPPTEGYRVWGLALNKEVIGSRRIFGVGRQTEGTKEGEREGRTGPSLFELPILLSLRPPPPAPFCTSKRDMSSQRGFNQKGPSAENGFYSDERIWVSGATLHCASTPLSPCHVVVLVRILKSGERTEQCCSI